MAESHDQLLHVIRQACVAEVRSNHPDLTLRQLGVLLVVYLTDEVQMVRGLAQHLKVQKPVISRVLDRLSELELVRRGIDLEDRRNVLVMRTTSGAAMMERLGEVMKQATQSPHDTA